MRGYRTVARGRRAHRISGRLLAAALAGFVPPSCSGGASLESRVVDDVGDNWPILFDTAVDEEVVRSFSVLTGQGDTGSGEIPDNWMRAWIAGPTESVTVFLIRTGIPNDDAFDLMSTEVRREPGLSLEGEFAGISHTMVVVFEGQEVVVGFENGYAALFQFSGGITEEIQVDTVRRQLAALSGTPSRQPLVAAALGFGALVALGLGVRAVRRPLAAPGSVRP